MDTTMGQEGEPDGWIAVVGQWRKDQGSVPLNYVRALYQAGGAARVLSTFEVIPVQDPPPGLDVVTSIEPGDDSVLDGACGLLLPGGGDIDPRWYGREPDPRTKNVSHRRDQFELTLLKAALRRDMPVLAICHGMQILNVHLGGTLIQHLPAAPLDHDVDQPRATPVHDISIEPSSRLAAILGATTAAVNSHHHQGLDDIAAPLKPVAWASDGVLEAVESDRHSWVVGVQWHPEAMAGSDQQQRRLFHSFVRAAKDCRVTEEPATAGGRTAARR